jgi:hypothetical protein
MRTLTLSRIRRDDQVFFVLFAGASRPVKAAHHQSHTVETRTCDAYAGCPISICMESRTPQLLYVRSQVMGLFVVTLQLTRVQGTMIAW